ASNNVAQGLQGSALDKGLALLAHELGDVVRPESALATGARTFPATERLHARPGASGRATAPIAVGHPGLNVPEKLQSLTFLVGENPGREAVFVVVGKLDGFVERFDFGDGKHRREILVLEQARVLRNAIHDGRFNKEAAGKIVGGQKGSARDEPA